MSIEVFSKLNFFSVGKYEYDKKHICDFRSIPRPHFCMGLLFEGSADFKEEDCEEVHIEKGDIIFVPITSKYISVWKGNPNITYISMHFSFEPSCGISEKHHFELQKVNLDGFDELKEKFKFALENYKGNKASQAATLGNFFEVLSRVLPKLKQKDTLFADEPIEKVLEYINANSEKSINVAELAQIGNMSIANFYVRFKKYTAMTPIEYKNQIIISRAVHLLKSEEKLSVEEISELLGFESSTYFRRVFKKITGNTPLQFRKSKMEL